MKDIICLMTQYNEQTNSQLYDLLAGVEETILQKNADSYFGSIFALLNHIAASDFMWLTSFRNSNRNFPSLNANVLNTPLPPKKGNFCNNFTDLRKLRKNIDAVFIALAEETSGEIFLSPIELKDPRGRSHTFVFGKILMHIFNHQTHHRGAIAQILDANKVENDYSNLRMMLIGQ